MVGWREASVFETIGQSQFDKEELEKLARRTFTHLEMPLELLVLLHTR